MAGNNVIACKYNGIEFNLFDVSKQQMILETPLQIDKEGFSMGSSRFV